MPDAHLLVAVAASLGALLVLCCAVTAAGKLLRGLADARDRRAEARVRPELIRLVMEEDGAGSAGAAGRRERGAAGRAVERIATELLGKVRGETHERLVAVLDGRGVLRRARRNLRRGSGVHRARAAELLGSAGDRDAVPDLLALARAHRRREVRIVAARALGRIGDPVAVPGLLDGLEARLPARTVAQAVLEIGPAAERALLYELQAGAAASVRALAAQVLGLLGSVTAGKALAFAIATDPDPRVRAQAAASAGRLGVPCAVDALVDALDTARSDEERAASAEALGRMSATASTAALVPLVSAADVRVAHAAACALASLGATGRTYLEVFSQDGGPAAEHAREALRSAA